MNIGIRLAFAASMLLSGGVEAPQPEAREPEPRWPHNRKRTIATIVMDGACGEVAHTHSPEPMTKRQKRRARGKAKA